MIQSFADKTTAALFAGLEVRRLPRELQQRAAEKLALLNAAHTVDDLRIPPGNRLEKLSGDAAGGGYAIGLDSGAFASTSNGGFASPLPTAMLMT